MEDKDIKLIQYSLLKINKKNATLNDKFIKEFSDVIGKLFRAYKQDEKVIQEMAEYIVNLIEFNNSEEVRDVEEIIDYFRKKCE